MGFTYKLQQGGSEMRHPVNKTKNTNQRSLTWCQIQKSSVAFRDGGLNRPAIIAPLNNDNRPLISHYKGQHKVVKYAAVNNHRQNYDKEDPAVKRFLSNIIVLFTDSNDEDLMGNIA